MQELKQLKMSKLSAFDYLAGREKSQNPFREPIRWWTEVMKKSEGLRLVGKEVIRFMTEHLASTYQEASFSFSGLITKGNMSRTGPLRLNSRTFLKLNFDLVKKDFEKMQNELTQTTCQIWLGKTLSA